MTAEEIISNDKIRSMPEATTLPHFMVDAVVHVPNGAYPCSCCNYYDVDYEHIKEYIAASQDDRFDEYLDQYVHGETVAWPP